MLSAISLTEHFISVDKFFHNDGPTTEESRESISRLWERRETRSLAVQKQSVTLQKNWNLSLSTLITVAALFTAYGGKCSLNQSPICGGKEASLFQLLWVPWSGPFY